MKRFLCGLGVVAAAGAVAVLTVSEPVEAKPPFLKLVKETYKPAKDSELGKANCIVCHTVDKNTKGKMKEWNKFGHEIHEVMESKGSKGLTAEILEEVAKKASATEGKSFGDLLKDGKLPAAK
jgi:geranylgeranyl pyrophosphate synthase